MAKVHLYLDVRHPRTDGCCQIKVSVFQKVGDKKTQMMIPTGVFISPKNWDEHRERDKRNGANNAVLSAYQDKVKEIIAECIKNGTRLEYGRIKASLQGVEYTDDDKSLLLPYFKQHAKTKRAERTIEIYLYTAKKIEEFAGDSIRFQDINHKWLGEFDRWMEKNMPSANSRGIHLRNLRHVINAAIDDGIISTYPFRRFSIKKSETEKLALSLGQFRMMINADLKSGWEYRDFFVLSFLLQGINIGDLCRLPVNCYDGERLRYRRAKTGKLYNIKIEPEAAEIINRYRGKNGVYLLDILERWKSVQSYRSKYDKRLKQIFPTLPHMSSNCARHTYATLLRAIDVPVETISQAMGHSIGSSVTAIYIKQDQRKVDEANRRLFDLIWQK